MAGVELGAVSKARACFLGHAISRARWVGDACSDHLQRCCDKDMVGNQHSFMKEGAALRQVVSLPPWSLSPSPVRKFFLCPA